MMYKPETYPKRRLCLLRSLGKCSYFYKDFEDATNDLIILGQIESGKENFENVDGDFTGRIEKVTK